MEEEGCYKHSLMEVVEGSGKRILRCSSYQNYQLCMVGNAGTGAVVEGRKSSCYYSTVVGGVDEVVVVGNLDVKMVHPASCTNQRKGVEFGEEVREEGVD